MSDAPPRSESGKSPSLRRLLRLTRKEVSTILRDTRTIITLVLMPLLLYPLLSIAFRQFLLASDLKPEDDPGFVVGFVSPEEQDNFARFLFLGHQVSVREANAREQTAEPLTRLQISGRAYRDTDELQRAVGIGQLDLGIRVLPQPGAPGQYQCEILYLTEGLRSRDAKDWVERFLALATRETLVQLQLRIPPRERLPILSAQPIKVEPPDRAGRLPLRFLIPLILILMTITGAVYPAIDLTAGERERGTLEILIAAPIPRLGLLFAKYLSVLTVAVLTAVVNLTTMTVTLLVSGMGPLIFGEQGLQPLTVVQIFLLLLLFAAFFSAVLLAVTSFARSFKEAQAYLIPLMLVSLTPGMLSLTGLELTGPMLVLPLFNIVLLTRDVFGGTVGAGVVALVVLTTVIYAVAAIGVAARVFGAEAVLYNEQASWADLFRRPARGRATATVTTALFCLALMFPVWFLMAGLLLLLTNQRPAEDLLLKAGATMLLFGGFPLLVVWRRRVQLTTGFQLQSLGWRGWVGAILLGVSLWPFASVVGEVLKALNLTTLTPQLLDSATVQLTIWRQVPLVVVLLCAAIIPAIFEELFFRGFLFSAILRATRPRTAILLSALFFGLFHLIGQQVLIVEWGLTASLLGLVLGWVAWRTGSVVPGMLLHALHNSCLVLFGYYRTEIIAEGWITPEQTTLPWHWLAVAAAVTLVAALWIRLVARPSHSTDLVKRDEAG